MLSVVLASLRDQTYQDLDVVVVDNGSEDGSVEYLREEWPEVNVAALPDNVGFAAAVNLGIRRSGGELVALLNNDMELDRRWLEELVDALGHHPMAGSATSKMLDARRRDVIDGAGDYMSWFGFCGRRGHGEYDHGQYETPEPVFSACAGSALYRREALDWVGLFDEDFFAYHEDTDWGFRAQLAGYECRYVPSAVVYHIGGATSKRLGELELYLSNRNMIALILKNYPAWSLVRYAPRIVDTRRRILFASVRKGQAKTLLTAWWAALRELPKTLRKRRAVQQQRRVPARHLEALLIRRIPPAFAREHMS